MKLNTPLQVRHSKDPDIWRKAVFSRWESEAENIGIATYVYEGITCERRFSPLAFDSKYEGDSETRSIEVSYRASMAVEALADWGKANREQPKIKPPMTIDDKIIIFSAIFLIAGAVYHIFLG